jgi:hypothetical protein
VTTHAVGGFHPGAGLTGAVTDAAATSVRASAALTAAYVSATAVDVTGFSWVDWHIVVTNKGAGPITSIACLVQYSNIASPAAGTDVDWCTLQSEAIAAGTATLSDYTPTKDISGLTATFGLGVSALVRGRWMRIQIKAAAGDPTGSAVSITALRRT